MKKFFTKMPNELVKLKQEAYNRLPYCYTTIFFLINRNRTIEDKSWIVIEDIFKLYGKKINRHSKPVLFDDIIYSIKYMEEKNLIVVNTDLDSVKYETMIRIDVNIEEYDEVENYTELHGYEFDAIMNCKDKISKDKLLSVFLYIKSKIIFRGTRFNGEEAGSSYDNPEAFFGSVNDILAHTKISKRDTVTKSLATLSSDSCPLLVKYDTGYGTDLSQVEDRTRKMPNIYVLNNENAEQEIEGAIQKLKAFYKKRNDEFEELY